MTLISINPHGGGGGGRVAVKIYTYNNIQQRGPEQNGLKRTRDGNANDIEVVSIVSAAAGAR